ncbi:hypothetical protein GC173_05365 [bacterium]|nr:hypothetical protein [bacterium]
MTLASLLGLVVLFGGVPTVLACLYAFPQFHRLFLAVMVFTTCYVKKPFYQEIFFVNYRGVDRGFAVTLPDLFFLAFYLFMIMGGLKRRVVWLPFNSIPWFLLIFISCLSLVGSIEPYYGLFTIHKMIRAWVFYVVMVNLVRSREDVLVVLGALASAVVFQGVTVFWAKYVTKAVVARSIGTFRHPNTLAMYTDLILPILAGALLTGVARGKANALYAAAIGLGIIAVLFTKSRAAMLLLPFSLGCVVTISVLMKPTPRKFMALGTGALVGALIVAVALPRLIRRFEEAPKESAETREYFNEAAHAMARDRLFGVGINQYSHALAVTDYYWYVYPDRTEEPDPEAFRETVQGQSRLGTAHHIYWLYAAETGYPGLVAFVLHTALFSLYNLYLFVRERDHLYKSIFLGMLVGTSIHHLHGTLEWIFRQTEVQYLYFVLMGLMVAIARMGRTQPGRLTKDSRKDTDFEKPHLTTDAGPSEALPARTEVTA